MTIWIGFLIFPWLYNIKVSKYKNRHYENAAGNQFQGQTVPLMEKLIYDPAVNKTT